MPSVVVRQLSRIAKSGFIATPSKYLEMRRNKGAGSARGYIHHRWIFSVSLNGRWKAFPKINFMDHDAAYDALAIKYRQCKELSFFWTGNIELEIVNNDFLGPTVDAVRGYYRELLDDGCDRVDCRC